MKHTPQSNFPRALRAVRKARGVAQEEFDQVSSRTYVSALERGIKQPTLGKVDQLADVLRVHPLTLLALAYCSKPTSADVHRLVGQIQKDLEALGAIDFR